MIRSLGVLLSIVLLVWACDTVTPLSQDDDMVPIEVQTVEVRLPFSEFADSLTTYGGYAFPVSLLSKFVANSWGTDLDSHLLVRFGGTDTRILVFPPGGTATVPDTAFRPVGGRVVVRLDSAGVLGADVVELGLGALQNPWHITTATWDFAVDTVGAQVAWPEPGGGPVTDQGVAEWTRGEGDSIVFAVDSATAAGWFESPLIRTARIVAVTEGTRVPIESANLIYEVRSSIRPDSIVDLPSLDQLTTILYSPSSSTPDPGTFRIGGVPAWRAVVHFDVPDELNGPPELCAVLTCPVALTPDRVLYAGILLTTAIGSPYGLTPLDTLGIDMRPVLAPSRLPRSPLGRSVRGVPTFLPPGPFAAGSESVELTLTNYFRDLLFPVIPGLPIVPRDLALLTGFEPWYLEFGTFWAPGTPEEPMLRLILTIAPDVPLP